MVNPRTRRAVHSLELWAGGLSMRGIDDQAEIDLVDLDLVDLAAGGRRG